MSHSDRHVVAGVDGSDASIALLDWAATYAAIVGADLKVVSSWQPDELPDHRSTRAEDDVKAALEDRLQHFVRQTCTGVPYQVVIANGDPTTLLLRESRGADLIVVGAQFGDRDGRRGSPPRPSCARRLARWSWYPPRIEGPCPPTGRKPHERGDARTDEVRHRVHRRTGPERREHAQGAQALWHRRGARGRATPR